MRIKEYLKHYEQNDDAFRIFYKARNYDLADRSVRAHSMYVQVINQFQDTFWAQESKYYLALLEYESSHYNKAEKLLIDLNTNYLIRNNLVKYYIGLINLVNNDYAKAKEYFMQSHYHYSRIELYKLDKNK